MSLVDLIWHTMEECYDFNDPSILSATNCMTDSAQSASLCQIYGFWEWNADLHGLSCDLFSGFPSWKVARRAQSALRATFLLFYAPQRAISLIIHEKDAKFFTFFRFPWHLEDGFGTILFRISQRTIPLKISRHENQGKWLKKASEGEAWCRLS